MNRYLRLTAVLLLAAGFALAAGSDQPAAPTIVPGDNLVVEGVPAIPQSLVEEIGRYSEMRSSSSRSWHPKRREMLIVTRFGDTYQIHQVQAPGAARTQLTFFPENIFAASFQPTTGDYIVFRKDKGGDEQYQYYRLDLSTGDSTLLTDGKSRNVAMAWSNAGDRFVYSSNRRNGDDMDFWVVSPTDPKSDRLLAQMKGGGFSAIDWSPDDKQILVMEEVSINETYLYLLDAQSGQMTAITPRDVKEKVAYWSARLSKDGKGVYVTSDKDSEFQRLAYIDLATKQMTPLTAHLNFDVDEFELSWDGSKIAFVTNENGMAVLRLMSTRTRKELPTPKLPVALVGNLRWHRNNRDLAFDMETSRSNYDPYSLDVTTGKVERWVKSETGGLNTNTWAEPQLIQWKSFDGRQITGFLYRPPARFTGKRPVVVDIHGGPEGQFRPGFVGRDNFQINELGVVVIYPNIRGSSGFGKTFLQMDNGFKREDSYKDIAALLDWIKAQPELDGDRIMVTGGSYGGHMTLAVATHYNDMIRCSVDIVGPSNLVTFLENTSGYRRDLRRVEYGDERDPKMREYLERIAPSNNASKVTKPLFVIQGANDPRVPRSESEQMVATIRKQGTPVWYLMAKDEGHGFAKKKNRDFEMYSTVLFMKEFLLK